jgi:hypothetical protein
MLKLIFYFLKSLSVVVSVYVGLYGYDYLKAGNKVFELFQARGWSVIINDHLVNRALGMMMAIVGVFSGMTGWLVHRMVPSWFNGLFQESETNAEFAFWYAFAYGILSSILVLNVVSSAVDTVVVCFAESPNELRANHPQVAQRMIQAWRAAYPSDCGF